jgi:predicted outer membrane repeat protein
MSFSCWLRSWKRSAPAPRRRTQASPGQRARCRPRLEALEDRSLPSTLTVTNTQDHGRGSLRAEIAAAHSGDTIVFSPSLDGKTITLTSGELDLTKNLTIQGPGAGQLTISGYGGHTFTRVFEVAPNTTVALSGLSIINGSGYASVKDPGYAPWDGYGGGILNLGTLTLSACTIDYSSALNEGGAIYSDGTLTVSGCTVYGNRAADGAGIATGGTATIVSSTISNNNASDTSPGSYQPDGAGGGISNGGTLTLSGCTVSGNYANWEGGGIFNGTSGTVTVKNGSSITGNTASDLGAEGYNVGVLYLDSTSTIGSLAGNPAIPI